MSKPRLIAFYLPQFYPTKENDEWWQKGFTEWTNVGSAKPLFRGHDQPRVPADLGYYDLRLPEIREQQVELAREAGIEGFCYWHYWFAGRRLLDRVFSEVVESGKPDFPFCLCWANHSWYQKTWDPTKPDKLLIEQTYPGEEDYIAHFKAMLPAFKDKRYMKVNGKLIFGIYSPLDVPNFNEMKTIWNRLANENGLDGFYFFGFTYSHKEIAPLFDRKYDSVVLDNIKYTSDVNNGLRVVWGRFKRKLFKIPLQLRYDDYMKKVLQLYKPQDNIHPCILPNFDHSPRSKGRGIILVGHSPRKWKKLCVELFNKVKGKKDNLVFLKAWNEWGEGNYMEPDMTFGKGFVEATRDALNSID